ncbi:MAG: NADH-quinone oxidoreductase subunit L [Chloroflexi bacterium]|nr:NADH-quinone oxidoreductase subunit L [Chloroflexota bacterium]
MLGVWLIPACPLAGFLLLALAGSRLSRRGVTAVGVGSVALSAACGLVLSAGAIASGDAELRQTLWTWMALEHFQATIGLHLDRLSMVMVWVVTGVGFLIHLYSAAFMAEDEGFGRFFAYLNLFVGSMLLLVLADDLLLLYVGWEGVGLCSYLLIGFWYRDPRNVRAAMKAFIVTRVGDAAMAVGLFLLAAYMGTLRIDEVMVRLPHVFPLGSPVLVAAAALLLAGAVGKSAQLPLQVWLPDAMAGPTPVSALIHAATMVTAGVYLIARTQLLFSLAPVVLQAVAWIGAATLLLAGLSALAQRDLKRILAYSTISQLGYMFLALGVGAWSAAVFHLVTHAFFKALLFLSAGLVIHALHEEHDIFAMGGLRRRMPLVFAVFTIGAASLAGLPLVTAGFYSKDAILHAVASSGPHGPWLLATGLIGALTTALYAFRAVFVVFLGEPTAEAAPSLPGAIVVPLVALAGLALVGGFVQTPSSLGGVSLFGDFVGPALAGRAGHADGPAWVLPAAAAASLTGLLLAWLLYVRYRSVAERAAQRPEWDTARRFAREGFGFDGLYDAMIVQPFVHLAQMNARDLIDSLFTCAAETARALHRLLSGAQTGRVRWYAGGLALGALLLLGLVVLR